VLADRAVRLGLTAKFLGTGIALVACLVAAALGVALIVSAQPLPSTPRPNANGLPQPQRVAGDGIALPAGVVARLGSGRLRHGGSVHDLCFSSDGQWIASAGSDRAIRVWRGNTGKQVFVVRRSAGGFDRVAFSDGGKTIFASGHDEGRQCDLYCIDRATGAVIARFGLQVACPHRRAIRFNADGTRLALGSAGQLRVIDTATGGAAWTVGLGKERPGGTAFSADGKTVAVSTSAGTVRLFDATGTPAGVLTAGQGGLKTVALSPDGQLVVAHRAPLAGQLVAWKRSSSTVLWTAGGCAQDHSPTFAPDGRSLVLLENAASSLGAADGKNGVSFAFLVRATASAYRPDGKVVAFGSDDGTICLFDPASGRSVAPSADPPNAVGRLRFSPDGKTLYGWAGDWLAWDLPKKGVAGGIQRRVTSTNWTSRGALSADGKWTTDSLEVRDAATGQLRYCLPDQAFNKLLWSDFTPDSKAIVAGRYYGTLRAWDLATGKELLRLPGHSGGRCSHAFSADGRVLVTGADGDNLRESPVRVYDLAARKELGKFHPGLGVAAVAVSADGRRVAAATTANWGGKPDALEIAIVWEVASGKVLALVPQHGRGGFVALSPDGRTLAVAADGRQDVRVWEVASERKRFHFRHDGTITGLAFSPDGRTLAVASKEAPIYLWDVTGELAGPAAK
jgi:WD40 repeat protein